MNHRHLLPEEIDLLLDDEEGFGVVPLREHVEGCPACMARLEKLRLVVASLEALPRLAPSPVFAGRVLSQVQVFEPWHVALRDRLAGLLPRSPAGRAGFALAAGVMATGVTAASLWILRRADAVLFVAELVIQRTRTEVGRALQAGVGAVLGDGAAGAALSAGPVPVIVATALGALALAGVALGVKAAATAGRRRRN